MRVLSNIAFVVFVATGLIFAQPGENEGFLGGEKVVAIVLGKRITYEDISPHKKMMEKKRAELSQEKFNKWLTRYRKDRLSGAIFRSLLEAYAQYHKIEPTEEEIKIFVSELREREIEWRMEWKQGVENLRKRLKSTYLSEIKKQQLKSRLEVIEKLLESREKWEKHVKEHSEKVEKAGEQVARQIIKTYKINKSLYDKYGGRVIFQQAGPEPLDAYRKFLEEDEKRDSFEIKDEDLAKDLWKYFTTEKHTFFSEEESAVMMESPWWLLEERLAERMKNDGDVGTLVAALKDPIPSIRFAAAKKLGKIGEPAVKALINVLRQTGENERLPYRAIEALSEVGEPAVKLLIIALKDENGKARASAAVALGKIEDESSVERLATALKDTDKSARSSAARALGNIGDTRAVEFLVIALKDENKSVRTAARVALEKITGKDFGRNLEKWQKWWEENKENFLKGR